MSDCVFCKIVKGEIPCEKIFEDERYLGFLDAFPSMKGQALIIPKEHLAPWMFDLDDKIYSEIMLVTKKVAKAIDSAFRPLKTGIIIEGLELDHVHVKIFPLSKIGFRDYQKKLDPLPSKDEMEEIAEKIRKELK
jgi:histidine triad (HIT) family protein